MKIQVKSEADIHKAINMFGKKYEDKIREDIKNFPCVLVAYYSDDPDFIEGYQFVVVNLNDFK